jgi:CubicO group peptidase (beta-lactamase class C family)
MLGSLLLLVCLQTPTRADLRPAAPSGIQSSFSAAAKYSAERGGVSFLVMKEGRVVAEEYPNGGSADRARELASGTKSFSGVMAACAVQDGLFKWDDRVSDVITEWKSDPRRSQITVRQLLSLSSGIPGGQLATRGGKVPSYSDAVLTEANADPGEKFQYGPTPYQCFGEYMRRKLTSAGKVASGRGRSSVVLDYMDERIFRPIGVSYRFWRRDRQGNPHLPSGAYLTAREWIKFGEMVRQGGKGVTSPKLLQECLVPQGAGRNYGLTWWLPTQNTGSKMPEVYMAAGAGGQRLYVIPSQGITAVRQAPIKMGEADDADRNSGFRDMEFLKLLLGQ